MALDGIAIANIVSELKAKLLGARIDKIYQPEKDEIVFNIRSLGENYKLLLTASPSHPRLHITTQVKTNPNTAPQFCMTLRKHLNNGKITEITQPNFERIVFITIESLTEMGDITPKQVVIEIMGKHSNIILLNETGSIIDSVKRISHERSSVREVLPGKEYVFPPSKGKSNPIKINEKEFFNLCAEKSETEIQTLLYTSYSGISPTVATEITFRAGLDSCTLSQDLSVAAKTRLLGEFLKIMMEVVAEKFTPTIYCNSKNKEIDFSAIALTMYDGINTSKNFDSISLLLDNYYKAKDANYRISQKSTDLKKIISNNLERCSKKRLMQSNTMKEIKNRDMYKHYGELITANIYSINKGMTLVTLTDFYSEDTPQIEIPLDADLTPAENAQKYFKRYNKEKRTHAALLLQMEENRREGEYFEQLLQALSTCESEEDLEEIRLELYEEGYVKKAKAKKNARIKQSKPLHFISSDSFDIYVGKNNKQNEELTLRFASNADIWLHTKNIPGSHVIVRTLGNPVPDSTLNEAAQLAAYYSKAKNGQLVPVDYTKKKNVKKPAGAKTGMVIYDHYQTAFVTPDEQLIQSIEKSK